MSRNLVVAVLLLCLTPAFAQENKELIERVEKAEQEIQKLEESLKKIRKQVAGDNVKFGIDFRTSYNHLELPTAAGGNFGNDVWSYRLILSIGASPTDHLAFNGALAVNKIFGVNNVGSYVLNNSDWFATVTPDDAIVRLREAYILYLNSIGNMPFKASVGRRPTLNGLGINFREDDVDGPMLSHIVNVEFDGFALHAILEKMTSIPGMFLRLCYGKGFSNASGKFSFLSPRPYGANEQDLPDMDIYAINFEPYNDGQYRIFNQNIKAENVWGLRDLTDPSRGFQDVNDMYLTGTTFLIDGIGDGSNDFLFDTKVFFSFALSYTDPGAGVLTTMRDPSTGTVADVKTGMLGSTSPETGYSFYAGIQIPLPSFSESDGKLGLEYNYGSKYWRSLTYGEDTLVGSKLATRGNAYEIYYIQQLIGDYLSFSINLTHIDYDYTGSNLFFGEESKPLSISDAVGDGMNPVDSATDIRFYIRYRY